MRGGIGLAVGLIGGYIVSSVIGPAATTTTTTSLLPGLPGPSMTTAAPNPMATIVGMLPFIGAIGGAYIGARKPEC